MKLFGTDGIRGKAGLPPLDHETVARVGAALTREFSTKGLRVVIGRDTRESGTWIEEELARGLMSGGATVVSAGVLPTPGVAYLARTEGFDAGLVISASHNPYEDNGIKVFSGSGAKLPAAFEAEIEQAVADLSWSVPAGAVTFERRPHLATHYLQHLEAILDDAGPLAGSPIAIDCANGATSELAPEFFASLGFEVKAIGVTPNGRNINLACGSTHLQGLAREVVETSARLGVAFDGDGDRALFVDHRGQVVDGDAILLMSALHLKSENRLPGPAVVATVMSNIGLEIALRDHGIEMVRTAVGDKYVMEEMVRRGLALGGEQSGHVIFAEHLFTGDGMATALNVLSIMAATGRELDELARALVSYPQVLVNVRVKERADYMLVPAIASIVRRVESSLEGSGRLLIRYSGTEPLLRIMLEGKDHDTIHAFADEIAGAVKEHLT
ncbi:MAG: phosphoglucosamine mutase [Vicinamibacterales bacterium]